MTSKISYTLVKSPKESSKITNIWENLEKAKKSSQNFRHPKENPENVSKFRNIPDFCRKDDTNSQEIVRKSF